MFWSALGAVSSRALALLTSLLVANVLGRSLFGELGIIQSTTNMFGTFANVAVGVTATKYVAEFRKTKPERAGRIIAMSTLVAVIVGSVVGTLMIVTSPWVARVLVAPHLQAAIAVSALSLLLIVVNDAQNGTLSGLEAFRRRSAIQFAVGIASLPATILGVCLFGLIGAVWALIAAQALLALLNYRAIQMETAAAAVPIRWREAPMEVSVLLQFSLPALCSGVVYVPSMWLANMLMVNSAGGYAQMGIFSAADRWRTAILFLPSLLGGVTLPMLSRLRAGAQPRKFRQLLRTNITLSVVASGAVAAPVALLASWIMASYGPGFGEGTWVLVTLCTASVAFSAYWIISQSLVSRGHVWTMFSFNSGWAVILLATEWFLRPQGALGLAVAYLAADLGRLAMSLVYAGWRRPIES